MLDDAVSAALEVAEILEGLAVPYMIGGSMASAVWGEPRFTRDVDIVAALEHRHVPELLARLGEGWYADEELIREAIARRSSFNLIRLRRMMKVDVFVPPSTGLHASKWARARRAALVPESERVVPITSPEDILLQKLDWYRSGGEVSDQQWRDLCAILRTRGNELDHAYLDLWAESMQLGDLLARARREAMS